MIRYYLARGPRPPERGDLPPRRRRRAPTSPSGGGHELVFKRVDGSGGKDLVIGPLRHRRRARRAGGARSSARRGTGWPSGWWPCPPPPRWVGGSMAPRHVDLRPFAVNDGERVWVLPGGLTRVALQEGGPGRQLQPGRGLQGHLGGGPARPRGTGGRRRPPGRRSPAPAPSPLPDRRRTAHGRRAAGRRRAGPAAMSNALLSRVAESIFWVGRYVERAEGTARILDVIVYQALEQSGARGRRSGRAPAGGHGPAARRRRGHPVAGHRAAGPRPREPLVDRRRPQRRPGEHPGRPPRDPGRAVGADQRHLVRPPPPVGAGPPRRSGLLPGLRQDPDGRHHRPGRHHHEPGPDVALLHPRPLPGADRRGRPPAGLPLVRRHPRQRAGDAAAGLRGLRALPAALAQGVVDPGGCSTSCSGTASSPVRPSPR